MQTSLQPIERLARDLATAARTLSPDEARFLVDAYYQMQENRIRAAAQVRALNEAGEPHDVLAWLAKQSETLELQVARALDKYSAGDPLGEWARSICGIGSVISAGLLAHIDMDKAPTVGHIWRFAGLDPTRRWEKGEKCPWNASLKTLCWKIGESFVKVKGNPNDIYGHVYDERKALEHANNDAGKYREQAEAIAKARPTHAQIKTYKLGKLPDGHLHARAKRYAVKLFLAHYHEMSFKLRGIEPPMPYPIAFLPTHTHWVRAQ